MDHRDLDEALDRWLAAGLIDRDQAAAIAAHEAALVEPSAPLASRIGLGAVLAYAGTLVALAAVLALYVTVFQDYTPGARLALTFAIGVGAGVLAWLASRFRAGTALSDALGLACTLILGWATLEVFRAAGWLGALPARGAPGYAHGLDQMRASFLGVGLVGTVVGYAAARALRSPLSAGVSSIALAWCAGVAVWWLADPGANAPGVAGGQAIVIMGGVLALLTLVPGVLGLRAMGRFWWQLGALGAANVAAFALAMQTGGFYEGVLLAYAVGLTLIAVLRGGRLFLVVGAVTLYEYVGLVIFRTFEGAVAAIVVLALIGLGTAFTGAFGERVGFGWLWRWSSRTPRRRETVAAPPAADEPGEAEELEESEVPEEPEPAGAAWPAEGFAGARPDDAFEAEGALDAECVDAEAAGAAGADAERPVEASDAGDVPDRLEDVGDTDDEPRPNA